MKVLFVCALVVAGAFVVKGGHELCAMSSDQITAVAKCMADKVDPELTGKARQVIQSQGGNVGELVKKQCEADIDFSAMVKAFLSPEQAESVKNAYKECVAHHHS